MFDGEQRDDGGDADEEQVAEARFAAEGHEECGEGGGVQCAADPDGAACAELGGDAGEFVGAIEVAILQGVDDIEPGDPQQDEAGEPPDDLCGCEGRGIDGEGGGEGAGGECAAQKNVAEGGEAFGVAVESDPYENGNAE